MTSLNEHGQPANRYFNASLREARAIEQMLGFVRGVICDGVVTDAEAEALREWLGAHPDLTVSFPGNVLAERLFEIFADGKIDGDERQELLWLLEDTIGERAGEQDDTVSGATRLPFTTPAPDLTFTGQVYVVTGMFAWGSRAKVEDAIAQRGATCDKSVTKKTNVLLVGVDGSRHWAHSSYGTKIERAVELRQRGQAIAIVGEEHWLKFIQ